MIRNCTYLYSSTNVKRRKREKASFTGRSFLFVRFSYLLYNQIRSLLRSSFQTTPLCPDDPKIFQLMSIWGNDALERWPIGVVWYASYLVYLGTAYGTKATYRSSINAFNTIFSSLGIRSPFARSRSFPPRQVDIFMALATMASYKAASTVRVAKCAAEDT